jgi:hypothetical protein
MLKYESETGNNLSKKIMKGMIDEAVKEQNTKKRKIHKEGRQ